MTKNRFILTFGVLGWGVLGGTLFAWWMSSSRGTSFWGWLAISLPIWCLGGYVFGLTLWRGLRKGDPAAACRSDAGPDASASARSSSP
jgi:hypothetical protein